MAGRSWGVLPNAGPSTNTAAAPPSWQWNVYKTPAFTAELPVFTNLTLATAYRGQVRQRRLSCRAAGRRGRAHHRHDRIELRRRNLLRKDAFPYKTPTGSTYDSGDPEGLLTQAARGVIGAVSAPSAEAKARGRLRHRLCHLHRTVRRRFGQGDHDPLRPRACAQLYHS